MKKQARKQKGFSPITVAIVIGVVVVIITVFISTRKGSLPALESTGIQQTNQSVPAIQNTNDFNTVASELDNTDLNGLDRELNQLDVDVSTF